MKNPKNRRPKKCVKLLFGKYLIFQMRCRFLRPCIPQTNKTNKRTHRLTFHVKGFSFWWTGYTESINVKWGVSTCPENSEIETLSKCRRHFHTTLVVFLANSWGIYNSIHQTHKNFWLQHILGSAVAGFYLGPKSRLPNLRWV